MLKEGLCWATPRSGPGTQARGHGSPAWAVVGAQGGPAGDGTSERSGLTSPGGRGVPPRRWFVLKEGMRRKQFATARAHQFRRKPSPSQAVVGAQGALAGSSNCLGHGHSNLGGRGFLRRRWWVLKEGLCGATAPNGPGTPA